MGCWRDAPLAVSPDNLAGNEGDLETHIDEQPLPSRASAPVEIQSASGRSAGEQNLRAIEDTLAVIEKFIGK